MKALVSTSCLVTALWLAAGGLVVLILGTGVMEVIALELAALVAVLVGAVLLLDDVLGPRS